MSDHEAILVWDKVLDYNHDVTWRVRSTKSLVGFADEAQYFRVIRDGVKHFFWGPEAYVEFAGGYRSFDEESAHNLRAAINEWHARKRASGRSFFSSNAEDRTPEAPA